MAKKTKDTEAPAKKEAKVKEPKVKEPKVKTPKVKVPKVAAPVDPVKTKNLIRLLNILALLLAIAAFLLQLFAVLSHHWKWQKTDLRSIMSSNVHDDSRLDQNYGLLSREIKLFANSDEHLDVLGSTRFPRVDDGEDQLHHCLSQTSSLRGALLTCSDRIVASEQCHCRRYAYWNVVIVFEILALIFLGLVVFLAALLTTQFNAILKLAGAALALLAFILLFIGLILILSHLKRETRSLADAYPHIFPRLANKLGLSQNADRDVHFDSSLLRRVVRRQTNEVYRVYPLVSGQYPFNETHFIEFSEEARSWIYKPYVTNIQPVPIVPHQHGLEVTNTAAVEKPDSTTAASLHGVYGPLLGYDRVFETTRAGLGWSTTLSILAMILALLLPLILIFSWLTGKKLGPDVKTITKTSADTAYVPLTQEIHVEKISAKPIPSGYDPQRPIGDAIVAAQNIGHGLDDNSGVRLEPVITHDVIIPGPQPVAYVNQEQAFPVTIDSTQTTQHA